MLHELPVSYEGQMVNVFYELKVVQKNDAWNDLTESGSNVRIPIIITQSYPE